MTRTQVVAGTATTVPGRLGRARVSSAHPAEVPPLTSAAFAQAKAASQTDDHDLFVNRESGAAVSRADGIVRAAARGRPRGTAHLCVVDAEGTPRPLGRDHFHLPSSGMIGVSTSSLGCSPDWLLIDLSWAGVRPSRPSVATLAAPGVPCRRRSQGDPSHNLVDGVQLSLKNRDVPRTSCSGRNLRADGPERAAGQHDDRLSRSPRPDMYFSMSSTTVVHAAQKQDFGDPPQPLQPPATIGSRSLSRWCPVMPPGECASALLFHAFSIIHPAEKPRHGIRVAEIASRL